MAKIDNQDLEHQRGSTEVNDKGVPVKPQPPSRPEQGGAGHRVDERLEREDREAAEAVRKLEESPRKLPPG